MAGYDGGSLPEDLRDWVDERAEAEGVDPSTILTRALSVYRLAVTDSGESVDALQSLPERLDDLEGELDSLGDDVDTLEDDIGGLEDDVDEKIDDVRMRVVQVKRETDGKAPRDHDHPDLQVGIDRATAGVEAVRDRLDELDDRVDAGFDNFEDVLSYLDETTADLDGKLRSVVQALLNVRARTADIQAAELERKALADLLRVANDANERKAKCEACRETVHLDLLTEPRCPACQSPFQELSASRGFFGSATLHTGTPPELEAAETDGDETTSGVEDIFDEATETDADVERPDPVEDTGNTEVTASGEHSDD
ncbi:magnesium transporter CorA family protein [Haloferax larsenii]|uniref:CopG family transcriptional regulator n=1 Tax=Haloferax larsenii TaxID=302484 RepID=A0A1H7UEF9_HALLR|nr:hypothetical protein [Haloferax larsenii]SEL94627.1 hypothetical protein SAMN04488691_11235 [Haloferax larsenii]